MFVDEATGRVRLMPVAAVHFLPFIALVLTLFYVEPVFAKLMIGLGGQLHVSGRLVIAISPWLRALSPLILLAFLAGGPYLRRTGRDQSLLWAIRFLGIGSLLLCTGIYYAVKKSVNCLTFIDFY